MKALGFSEEVLSIFDIFSYKFFDATNQYIKYLNPHVLLISQCALIIGSAEFLRKTDYLPDWMMALVQVTIVFAVTGAFLCLAMQLKNISRLHNQLQDIVNGGKITGM